MSEQKNGKSILLLIASGICMSIGVAFTLDMVFTSNLKAQNEREIDYLTKQMIQLRSENRQEHMDIQRDLKRLLEKIN